jgi:hypothetical protein
LLTDSGHAQTKNLLKIVETNFFDNICLHKAAYQNIFRKNLKVAKKHFLNEIFIFTFAMKIFGNDSISNWRNFWNR